MVDLIRNTVETIVELSNSNTGYILTTDSAGFHVPVMIGDQVEDYEVLNNFLSRKISNNGLVNFTTDEKNTINQLINELALKSIIIRDITPRTITSDKAFLVLLSDVENNYPENDHPTFMQLLTSLSHQFELWFESRQKPAIKSVDKIPATDQQKEKPSQSIEREPDDNDNFKEIMEISEDIIFYLDEQGTIRKINRSGAFSLDYRPSELIGKHLISLIREDELENFTKSVSEAIRFNSVASLEVQLLSKFGKEEWYAIRMKPVTKQNELRGIIGIAKNLEKLKSLQKKLDEITPLMLETERLISVERARAMPQKSMLEELNRLKNEFISNISHELRTPLASIIGFSETIESDPELPEEVRNEFNRIILEEGKRLAKLINDVLDLSRIEGGNITLNKNKFDIIKLISEVISAHKKSAENKLLSLTIDLPSEEVEIYADRDRLYQVFSGILNNAVKFTEKGGRITVSAHSLSKEVEVVISDTGIGIPEKELPLVFQKFYKVSRHSGETPGTGLGLVFVKQIVDLHKGVIIVQSQENKGTSVIIKLLKNVKVNNS
ncbi:MAG: hypothetical protein Kow0098_15570 [Ignavibacteriaceae bacterium]